VNCSKTGEKLRRFHAQPPVLIRPLLSVAAVALLPSVCQLALTCLLSDPARACTNAIVKRHESDDAISKQALLYMDNSKDERIAARRLRIQQKLAMKHGTGGAGAPGAAIIMRKEADVRIGKLILNRMLNESSRG
jgi:hypothetical protein